MKYNLKHDPEAHAYSFLYWTPETKVFSNGAFLVRYISEGPMRNPSHVITIHIIGRKTPTWTLGSYTVTYGVRYFLTLLNMKCVQNTAFCTNDEFMPY